MPRRATYRRHVKRYRQEPDGTWEKWCSTCDVWWPATSEFFAVSRQLPDGLENRCKDCKNARRRELERRKKQ